MIKKKERRLLRLNDVIKVGDKLKQTKGRIDGQSVEYTSPVFYEVVKVNRKTFVVIRGKEKNKRYTFKIEDLYGMKRLVRQGIGAGVDYEDLEDL